MPGKVIEFERLNDNKFYHPLAPRTAAQFFSGDVDAVWITRESTLDKWWVKDSGRAMSQSFVLFDDARAAAIEIIADAQDEMRGSILRGLQVSPDEWTFDISEDYLVLTSTRRDDVSILASMEYPTWSLNVGEEIVAADDQISVVLRVAEEALSAGNHKPSDFR